MAYKKFAVTARASFKNAVVALPEHFELESRRDLYLAEFESHCKKKNRVVGRFWWELKGPCG